MKIADVEVLPAQSVRSSLTTPGDIRSDIAFQNDINNLLARIEEAKLPWTAASLLVSFGAESEPAAPPRRNSVTPPLRVFDGGAAVAAHRPVATGSRPATEKGAGKGDEKGDDENGAVAAAPPPRRMRRRA